MKKYGPFFLVLAGSISLAVFFWGCAKAPLPETILLDMGAETYMAFRLIPAGSFFMGSPPGAGPKAAGPRHEVYLDDYYMGVYEVSNRQFLIFVEETGYVTTVEKQSRAGRIYGAWKNREWGGVKGVSWRTPEGEGSTLEGRMDHPVVHIGWYDAEAFCSWLSGYSGHKVRLPAEAQWEKAARAGDDSLIYPWGNTVDPAFANIEVPGYPPGGTVRVDSFYPNLYGLYNLGGNVSEWTMDWYKKDYYRESPYQNPPGPPEGRSKTRRGGHWKFNPDWECRIISRRQSNPTKNNYALVGFRCAIEP